VVRERLVSATFTLVAARVLRTLSAATTLVVIGAAAARAEVLIGVVGALTGPNAYQGEQQQQGVEMAISDLNARGGVLGQQLKLISLDDACDSGQAVAAAHRLVAAKVPFVVGHQCSGSSIPAAKIYQEGGIVQISPASTNPTLTEEGRANVFRVCGRDDQQGEIAGDYLAEHWPGAKIAILSDGSVYGKGLAEETRRQLNRRGIAEVLYEDVTPGLSDYSPVITKLQAAGSKTTYFGGYYREAALLVRTARELGHEMQLVSGDGIANEAFAQVAGEAGEGTLLTFFRDPRRNPGVEPLLERFRKQGFEPEGYTLYSYGAVQAWAQAVDKAGSIETNAVISALRTNEFDTVLGRISFDARGDIRQSGFDWYVWRGGRYVPLE
jgi:branched-chain amino acid transport system substrate-binding protein